jgi:hypothetical protein
LKRSIASAAVERDKAAPYLRDAAVILELLREIEWSEDRRSDDDVRHMKTPTPRFSGHPANVEEESDDSISEVGNANPSKDGASRSTQGLRSRLPA